jgi:hypothetical protein
MSPVVRAKQRGPHVTASRIGGPLADPFGDFGRNFANGGLIFTLKAQAGF